MKRSSFETYIFRVSLGPFEISSDCFGSIEVTNGRVLGKRGEMGYSEGDIRTCGYGTPVEGSNGF